MKESRVEEVLVNAVHEGEGLCWKWSSPGRRGVPDRIVLLPIPPEHREIVAKYVRFVETKQFGKGPTKQQEHVHGLMRGRGYQVDVISSADVAREYLKGERNE
jgi:hypothetical protein